MGSVAQKATPPAVPVGAGARARRHGADAIRACEAAADGVGRDCESHAARIEPAVYDGEDPPLDRLAVGERVAAADVGADPGPEIVPETTDAGEGTEDAVATQVGLEPGALPPQPIAAAPISEIRDGTLARETGTVGSIRQNPWGYPKWWRVAGRLV